MKSYPSIPRKIQRRKVWTFDKLDGSNIRAEWSNKQGFYKFGSRTRLIDKSHPVLGEAITLIEEKAEQLSSIFLKRNWGRVVAFFEFYGENSFAGSHEGEEHVVTLIDVGVYKRGMLEPEQFVELFNGMAPRLLHKGVVDEELIDSVKDSTLDGMTFEGVVCKYTNKNTVKMFKVKSREWLDRLRAKCGNNEALFRKLM